MSMQLQSKVVLEKIQTLTVIKNEPPESEIVEIGIDDILDSSDEESIPDIKDIEIVLHELSEDLIKSKTVSENILVNNHRESMETQIFVKSENNPFIQTENITQSENLNETENTNDENVNRGTGRELIKVQGSNEHFNAFGNQIDKQFVLNFSKNLSDESTTLAKAKHACNKNKSTHKQNKKRYCYEKCTFISENHSYFKRHKLSHKTKAEVDGRYLKYRCDKCKYKTCRSDHFKRHKLIHLKPEQIPYFYCYHCSYKCKQKDSLKIHIFNHFKKEEVSFHCYICNFTTLKRNLIIEHFKKHPKHHSKCDETDYKIHLKTHTKKRMRYSCEKCLYTGGSSSYFKRHQLTHKTKAEIDDPLLKYRCDKCKYKTCWSSNFKRHKLKHLKPEEIPHFYCYHCPYKCKEKSHLKIHIFNHFKKQEIPFHCYICAFTTLKRNLITEHLKKHPKHHSKCDERDYKNQLKILYFYCYHCSYKCKRKDNLKIHIFNHFKKQEVPFHCYICDFTTLERNLIIEHFKNHLKHHSKCDETDYKIHLKTYTKKRMRYSCEKCLYTGGSSSYFKRHQLTHKTKAEIDDPLLKYRCDKCKYKTCWSSNFKRHKLKHLKPEEIPHFYCYHCPYKCKEKSRLKIHIFYHFKIEEVPFHCYICDFTTLKRNLIIEHLKKHPKHNSKCDERDYKNQLKILYFYCYHCPYNCKRKDSLKTHIFRHFKNEDVPFHCYICDFMTLKRESFKKHLKHHNRSDETI